MNAVAPFRQTAAIGQKGGFRDERVHFQQSSPAVRLVTTAQQRYCFYSAANNLEIEIGWILRAGGFAAGIGQVNLWRRQFVLPGIVIGGQEAIPGRISCRLGIGGVVELGLAREVMGDAAAVLEAAAAFVGDDGRCHPINHRSGGDLYRFVWAALGQNRGKMVQINGGVLVECGSERTGIRFGSVAGIADGAAA